MIDPVAVEDYILPKTFGILAYVCWIIHILCGVVFTGVIIDLKNWVAPEFTCDGALESKTQLYFSTYQQHYNVPLRFYIFVLLSTWFSVRQRYKLWWVVGSLWVRGRVEQVDSNINQTQTDGEADNQVRNYRTFYVFRWYLSTLLSVSYAV